MANWWEQDELVESSDNWWEQDELAEDPGAGRGIWSSVKAGGQETAAAVLSDTQDKIYSTPELGRYSGMSGITRPSRELERPDDPWLDDSISYLREAAAENREIAEMARPDDAVGAFVYDAGTAIAENLAPMAVGIITRNPNLGMSLMTATSYGRAHEDAIRKGKSEEKAVEAGVVSALAEMGPVKLFRVFERTIGARGAKDLLKVAVSEAGQEMTTEQLNMLYEVTQGEDVGEFGDIMGRVMYAGALGSVAGGAMGVPGIGVGKYYDKKEQHRQNRIEWERTRAEQAARDEAILAEQEGAPAPIDPNAPWTAEAQFTTDWLGQEVAPTRIAGLEDEKDILDEIEARAAAINENIEQEAMPDRQELMDIDRLDQDRLRSQRLREEMGEDFDPRLLPPALRRGGQAPTRSQGKRKKTTPAEMWQPETGIVQQDEFQLTMPVDPQEMGSPERAPWEPPTPDEIEASQLYRMRLEEVNTMDESALVDTMPPFRQEQYLETEDVAEQQQLLENQREILREEAAEQRAGRGVLRVSRQDLYDARNEEEATRLEDDRQAANLWDYKAENRSWNNNIDTALQLGEQLSKEELVTYHKRAGEKGKWEVIGIDPESMMARVKWTQKRKQGDGEVEFTWKIGEPETVHVVRTDAGVQSRVNSTKKKPPNELIHQVDKVGAALILTGGDAARFPSRGTDKGVKRDVPFIGAPRAKALVESLYEQLVRDYRGSLAPKGRLVEGAESREKVDPQVLEDLYEEAKRLASRNITSVEKAVRTGTFVGVDAPTLVQVPGQHTFEQDMGQVITLMEKGAKQRLNSGQTVLEKAYQVMVDGSIREIEITMNSDRTGYEMTPIAQGMNRFTGKVPTEPFAAGKPDKRWVNRQRDLGRGATVEEIITNEKIDRANKIKEMEAVHKRKLSQAQIEKRKETAPESAAEYARRREAQRTPEQARQEALELDRQDELYALATEQKAERASEKAGEGVSPEEGTVPLSDIQKAEETAAQERPVAAEEAATAPKVDREGDLGLERRAREVRQDPFYNFKSTPRTLEESLARSELEKALDSITPYVQSITAPGSLTVPSAVGRLQRARVRRALLDVMKAVEAAGPQGTGQARMILSAPLDMPRMWGNLVESMKRLVEQDATLTAEQKELMDDIIVETYAQNAVDEHGRIVGAARNEVELDEANRQLIEALREIRALPRTVSRKTGEGMTPRESKTLTMEGKKVRARKDRKMSPRLAAEFLMQFEGVTPQRALSIVEDVYDMQLGQEMLLKLEELAKSDQAPLPERRVNEAGELVYPTSTERAGFVPERARGEIAGERRAGEPTQWDLDRPIIENVQEDLRNAAREATRTTGLRGQLIEAGYRRPQLDPRYETGEESRLRQRRKVEQIKRRKEERQLREKEEALRQQEAENRQQKFEQMREREVAAQRERERLNKITPIPLTRPEMGQRFEERTKEAANYINDPQQLALELPPGKPSQKSKKGDTKKRMQKSPKEWSMELSANKKVVVAKEGLSAYEQQLADSFRFDKKTGQALPVSQTKGRRKKTDFTFRTQTYAKQGPQARQAQMQFDQQMESFINPLVIRGALDFQQRYDVQPENMTGASAAPSSNAARQTAQDVIVMDRTDPLGREIFMHKLAQNVVGRKVLRFAGGKTSSLVGRSQKHMQQEHMRVNGLISAATNAYENAWAKAQTIMKEEGYEKDNRDHQQAVVGYLDDMSISEAEQEYGYRIPDDAAAALDEIKGYINTIARMGVEFGAFSELDVRQAIEAGHGYTHKSLSEGMLRTRAIGKRLSNMGDELYAHAVHAWGLDKVPHQLSREEALDMFLNTHHSLWMRDVTISDDGMYQWRHVNDLGQVMVQPLGRAYKPDGKTKIPLTRKNFKDLSDRHIRNIISHGFPNSRNGAPMLEGVINRMIQDITGRDPSAGGGLGGVGADQGIQMRREFLKPDRQYNLEYNGYLMAQAKRLGLGEQYEAWWSNNSEEAQGWSTRTFLANVQEAFPQMEEMNTKLGHELSFNKMFRQVLGEMTDPESVLADTAGRLARTVGSARFLNSAMQQGLANGWAAFDNPPKGWLPIAPKDSNLGKTTFTVRDELGNNVYKLGSDLYVQPEVAEAVSDMFAIQSEGKGFELAYKASGLSKYMFVVASPLAHARNFASTATIHAARNLVGSNADLAYKLGGQMFYQQLRAGTSYKGRAKGLETFNPAAQKVFDYMLNEGMLFDGGKSGAMYDLNREDGTVKFGKAAGSTKIGRGASRIKYFADNTFRLEDEGVKGVGFIMATSEYLEFVHGRKDLFEKWANGDSLSTEELAMVDEALAAGKEVTLDKYPTFSRVGSGVKTLSRLPLVGAFPSFTHEMLRTSYHAARLDSAMMLGMMRKADGTYVKAPHAGIKARLIASTRLAGNAGLWTSGLAASAWLASVAMETAGEWFDDDDEDAANSQSGFNGMVNGLMNRSDERMMIRSALPWYMRTQGNVLTKVDRERNTMTVASVDYMNPVGGITNALAYAYEQMARDAAMGNDKGVDVWAKFAGRTVKELYFGEEPLFSSISDRWANPREMKNEKHTPAMQRVANSLDNWVTEHLGNAAGAVAGGAMESLAFPMLVAQGEDLAQYIQELAVSDAELTAAERTNLEMLSGGILHIAGFKQTTIDPERWGRTFASDLLNYKQATSEHNQMVGKAESYEEMLETVKAMDGLRRYQFQGIHNSMHTASKFMGMSVETMQAELDKNQALRGKTGDTMPQEFWRGEYYPVTEQAVFNYLSQQVRELDMTADEAQQQYDWFVQASRELQPEQMTYGNE